MRFYINTKEAKHERPHVHVSPGRGARSPDLKIWLDDMTIGDLKGVMSAKDVAKAIKLVDSMRNEFVEEYEEMHGKKRR